MKKKRDPRSFRPKESGPIRYLLLEILKQLDKGCPFRIGQFQRSTGGKQTREIPEKSQNL